MKADISQHLKDEHQLILRMISLLEVNAKLTLRGRYSNWQFYLDGVEFIRAYADRFHHAKEEHVLFEALVRNGMPAKNSPVAAMLMEHEQGRAYVHAMATAAAAAMAGAPDQETTIAENALAYCALLRQHIAKEDDILYPLAERVIPDTMRDTILAGYQAAEADMPAGLTERYRAVVERYEREQ